jgi:hypothetical protein
VALSLVKLGFSAAAEVYFEKYGVAPLDDEAVERIEAEWRGDEPPKRSRRRAA